MPLLKKIGWNGPSAYIVLPKEWLDNFERQGLTVEEVEIEVSDNLTITPILKPAPTKN